MSPSMIFKLALEWAGKRYDEGIPAECLLMVMEFALWLEEMANVENERT